MENNKKKEFLNWKFLNHNHVFALWSILIGESQRCGDHHFPYPQYPRRCCLSTPLTHTSSLSPPFLLFPSVTSTLILKACNAGFLVQEKEGGLECPSGHRSKPQSPPSVSRKNQHLDPHPPSSCIFSLSSDMQAGRRGMLSQVISLQVSTQEYQQYVLSIYMGQTQDHCWVNTDK